MVAKFFSFRKIKRYSSEHISDAYKFTLFYGLTGISGNKRTIKLLNMLWNLDNSNVMTD